MDNSFRNVTNVAQGFPTNQMGAGDIFLWVKGAKSGEIKGESQDSADAKQIDVVSWCWGMRLGWIARR